MVRSLRIPGCLIGALLCASCTLYTVREYGPQESVTVIIENSTFEEVVRTLGSPDVIHPIPGTNRQICIYHSLEYRNYLSLYAETLKKDFVLTFDGDKLIQKNWLDRGMTTAIIAGQGHQLGVNLGD